MDINTKKRCVIVGTAPSYKKTPWSDLGLKVWTLNDAWVLGLPRIDRLYELHPLNKMWFRKKDQIRVNESDVPQGFYVRPEGHLGFLKEAAKTIPVFLQDAPPDDWPANAHRFPIEDIHQAFGEDYWASGPSYMLAQAVLEGYTDIWITGIHLSTEHEYREQRPQWEHLIGRILGRKVTVTEKDGFRFYQGDSIRVVMPVESPILQHPWKYAYEERPKPVQSEMDREWKNVQKEKSELIRQLVNWPEGVSRKKAMDRLSWLEVIEADIQQQQHRQVFSGGTVTIELHPAVMPVRLEPVQVGG